ncbi:hypothetical protein [Methylobacterium sp. J-070]|uniref:hypothetical protein n=1 Tax=Methylobacterium sp. J-070 TaxID=2836650 RepID=UPI001FB8BC68|nr:hypothetical protein [Methylobacterium sp. J-070]MCJ2050192.1 hypothetical protein [Methylobacterium sp. J-070]
MSLPLLLALAAGALCLGPLLAFVPKRRWCGRAGLEALDEDDFFEAYRPSACP